MSAKFSLTSLFLLTAIVALWLMPVRSLVADRLSVEASRTLVAFLGLMLFGPLAGLAFGIASALWNGLDWLSFFGRTFGGALIGAAAGIQLALPVKGYAIVVAWIGSMAILTLVVARRRPRPPAEQSAAVRSHPLGNNRGSIA